MRPSWDEYYLGIAQAVSLRGDCTRAQVGAIVVLNHSIVATGYNGAPPGAPGCLSAGACPRALEQRAHRSGDYDNCISVHAEANALLRAGRERTAGATLYCTHEACAGCAKLIAAAGIARVVTPMGERARLGCSSWAE